MASARSVALLALAAGGHAALRPTPLDAGPLPGIAPGAQPRILSGYIPVRDELVECRSYLYFSMAVSEQAYRDDPLMVWLNGGPGSSSMLGMFWENGPVLLDDNGDAFVNEHSWHKLGTSYVAIDQPIGVGYSYSECGKTAANESSAMQQLAGAIDDLMNIVLPNATGEAVWQDKALYIFGESYGGKYVPEVSQELLDNHKHVNLVGIGVGDGWVDPAVQQFTYTDFAFEHGLIGLSHKEDLKPLEDACSSALANPQTPQEWKQADKTCAQIENFIVKVSGVNMYDVRMIGDYNYTLLATYLNRKETRAALHIPDAAGVWTDTDALVADTLECQEQIPATHIYTRLFTEFPHMKVLLYNGVFDMDCNQVGTTLWLDKAYPQTTFSAAPRKPWVVGGKPTGFFAQVGSMTQLLLNGAGHLVPKDMPVEAAAMVRQFLKGEFNEN